MMYALREEDRERVNFLMKTAILVLRKLQIGFSHKYLEKALMEAYYQTTESNKSITQNPQEITIIDKDDASNLAIILTEALKKYHIKNEVTEISHYSKNEVTLAILAKEKSENYRQLVGIAENLQHQRSSFSGKRVRPGLIRLANGIKVENFVALGKSKFSEEPGYAIRRNQEILQRIFTFSASLFLILVCGWSIYNGIKNYGASNCLPPLLFPLVGLFICYHLFKVDKLDSYSNSLVKKFCLNAKKHLSCQKVLSSNASKFLGIISMTDIGVVYFASLFAFTISGLWGPNFNQYLAIVCWLSLIPLPYTLFSIYYQLSIVKSLCLLCFITQVLLWAQAGYFLAISSELSILAHSDQPLFHLVLIASIISGLYFLVVRNLELSVSNSSMSLKEFSLKNDINTFRAAYEQQPEMTEIDLPGSIKLGNATAANRLVIILSPACEACIQKLHEVIKLADWFQDNIDITILIKTDKHTADILKDTLEYTLDDRHEEALNLLTAWFDFVKQAGPPAKKNIHKWHKKCPVHRSHPHTEAVYAMHLKWHQGHFTPYTPFIIFNGRWLPGLYYDIDSLKYIIETYVEEEYEPAE